MTRNAVSKLAGRLISKSLTRPSISKDDRRTIGILLFHVLILKTLRLSDSPMFGALLRVMLAQCGRRQG